MPQGCCSLKTLTAFLSCSPLLRKKFHQGPFFQYIWQLRLAFYFLWKAGDGEVHCQGRTIYLLCILGWKTCGDDYPGYQRFFFRGFRCRSCLYYDLLRRSCRPPSTAEAKRSVSVRRAREQTSGIQGRRWPGGDRYSFCVFKDGLRTNYASGYDRSNER